ncbi:hypothetical protein J5N97_017033 [Dioscorea zingiberensis]|uniref:Neprosin PEP catalytic domain-containing protein n=1 Tax=Dioscorea zingiberensis TaxID=325984 RepID=A0A9D5CMG5_9LILI|nr:hypothetical protein J5N97_017033 [Dioscorea zingiberensis]
MGLLETSQTSSLLQEARCVSAGGSREGGAAGHELNLQEGGAAEDGPTKDGDVIDCVDVNEQPTLDHPLLKNHSIQLRPSFYSTDHIDKSLPIINMSRFKNEECPAGTIPIKRTTREDLIGFKNIRETGEFRKIFHPSDFSPPKGVHGAILQSQEGIYNGAKAWFEICRVPEVSNGQYSSATMAFMTSLKGPSYTINVIIVGWAVHPDLYGDNYTRLTIFWTTDGYKQVQCLNHFCPGFVQKSLYIYPGYILEDSEIQFLSLSLHKDQNTGNWWLELEGEGHQPEPIGYWPKDIFTSLNVNPITVQWGGNVYSPPNIKSPAMGNGHFPDEKGVTAASVNNIYLVDDKHKLKEPSGDKEKLIVDRKDCYGVSKLENVGQHLKWMFRYGESLSKTKFARVYLEIDLAFPLKRGFWLEDEEKLMFVMVQNEKIPMFCYSCGLVGHRISACSSRQGTGSGGPSPGAYSGSGFEQNTDGKVQQETPEMSLVRERDPRCPTLPEETAKEEEPGYGSCLAGRRRGHSRGHGGAQGATLRALHVPHVANTSDEMTGGFDG